MEGFDFMEQRRHELTGEIDSKIMIVAAAIVKLGSYNEELMDSICQLAKMRKLLDEPCSLSVDEW